MSTENPNWFHDLFISEAKAAKDYHNRGGSSEETPTQEKTVDITENGTVIVNPDEGHTMTKVTANVNVETPLQEKTVDITANGTVVVEPDEGFAMSKVTANVTAGGVDKIQKYIDLNLYHNIDHLFRNFRGTTIEDLLDGVDTSLAQNAISMFQECSSLKSVPLFDTSNVTMMMDMFNNCQTIETIPLYNTHKVTNMMRMFYNCQHLKSIPLLDTSSVTNMSYMFQVCPRLETIPLLDTSNVSDSSYMFYNCSALETIPELDFSKSNNTHSMFSGCTSLRTLPALDVGSTTHINSMFAKCSSLQTIPSLKTSGRVVDAQNTFAACTSLKTVPLFDCSKATYVSGMFNACASLQTVPAFDFRSVTVNGNIFAGCTSLTECWIRNIKTSIQVGSGTSWGHLLTVESLLSLCKECRKTSSNLTLTIGAANLEKLAGTYVKLIDITDEMRAEDDLIDEKYPFVVCESTDEGAMLVEDYMTLKLWALR